MADTNTTVHIGENSPEQVAYKLLETIANIERVSLTGWSQENLEAGWRPGTREWLLDAYAECLKAVRSPSGRNK